MVDGLDLKSFHLGKFVGGVTAWCEAARSEAKDMSFSSPFHPKDHDQLLTHMDEVARQNEVKFYMEKNLLTTDLFADIDMEDRWVFIIYKKEQVLEDYLALKAEKERLEKGRKYAGDVRREIAQQLGRLLGYSDDYIAQSLEKVAEKKTENIR